MEAIEILKRAALEKCRECGGSGRAWKPGGNVNETMRCWECDGTGLWLPELSEECPYDRDTRNAHALGEPDCCDGSGRIPVLDDAERLDAAAERLGMQSGIWTNVEGVYAYLYGKFPNAPCQATGTTRLEARQAALAAVVLASGLEVSDGTAD